MATPRGGFPSPGRMGSERRTASGSQKPGPLFSWFVEQEFSPWSAQTHRSPNTHKRYAVSAKSLVGFCGNSPVTELTPGIVERYKLWRIGQCGPTGVNRDIATLRFMLNFAIRLGYIKDNPVTGVKMLAEPQDRMHVLSHTEERAYLRAASRTLRDVGVLILGTGMRPAEVLSLKCDDMHLAEQYALVPKGKTRAARRTLPLTESALQVLGRRIRGELVLPLPTKRDGARGQRPEAASAGMPQRGAQVSTVRPAPYLRLAGGYGRRRFADLEGIDGARVDFDDYEICPPHTGT
jgi:integrase